MKGFTLIELMIVIAIIGILAAIFITSRHNRSNGDGSYCVAGYKVLVDANGNSYQMHDEYGRAIPCNKK